MRAWVVAKSPLIPLIATLFPITVTAASLEPATLKAWDEYTACAKDRMEQRLSPGNTFLWVDEQPERLAKVRAGEIVVSPVRPNPKKTPSGLIHDWLGAAFIPNVNLNDVLNVIRDYRRYKDLYQPAVIDSRAIDCGEAKDRYSTVLINKSAFVKMALEADYESRYVLLDGRRAYSTSRATRIQEIDDYGLPSQRMLPEDEGKGIIWRLFSITRYAERDGGVYLEFEAIGLSRDIPASLRWIVEPIVRRISRSSLLTSLKQTEHAAHLRAELANKTKLATSAEAIRLAQP